MNRCFPEAPGIARFNAVEFFPRHRQLSLRLGLRVLPPKQFDFLISQRDLHTGIGLVSIAEQDEFS